MILCDRIPRKFNKTFDRMILSMHALSIVAQIGMVFAELILQRMCEIRLDRIRQVIINLFNCGA